MAEPLVAREPLPAAPRRGTAPGGLKLALAFIALSAAATLVGRLLFLGGLAPSVPAPTPDVAFISALGPTGTAAASALLNVALLAGCALAWRGRAAGWNLVVGALAVTFLWQAAIIAAGVPTGVVTVLITAGLLLYMGHPLVLRWCGKTGPARGA